MFDSSHLDEPDAAASPLGMRCRAAIGTELTRGPRGSQTRISRLRPQSPLVPRPTGASGFEPYIRRDPTAARVALTTAAAGPLGGDEYLLDVHVGAGSTLLLREVSATLVLPGALGDPSLMRCTVRVDAGATLIWVPEPVIAANDCQHTHIVDIDLAADARLLFREELVLGRHHEPSGSLSSRLTVTRDGAPVTLQRFDLGPGAAGYSSPAVVGHNRGVGSVVIVEPEGAPAGRMIVDPLTTVLPIDATCVQVNALGADSLALRHRLDSALAVVGEPWGSESAGSWSGVPR